MLLVFVFVFVIGGVEGSACTDWGLPEASSSPNAFLTSFLNRVCK